MTSPATRHANPAKQKRSQKALDTIVAAAEIVLGRDGWHAFTMNAVAEEAKASIGGIYRRFASKEQLLRAIKENVLTRADVDHRKIADEAHTKDLSDAIAHYVLNRIKLVRSYSDVMRQIFEGQNNDPVMEERGRRSINLGLRTFRSVLSPHRGEIGHKDHELAIDTAFFMMNAVIMRRVRTPISDQSLDHIDWDVLKSELLIALTLYLKLGGKKPAQPRK